jgi:hypothetical protein
MSTPDNKNKKLILIKETIVPLAPDDLDNVVGGAIVEATKGNSCCLFNSCNKTKLA